MDQRLERTVTVINPLGLHARAAAQLVKLTARMPCEVTLEFEGQEVNGKSIMGVLMLVAAKGTFINVRCDGPDAQAALAALSKLVQDKFGEE